MRQERSPEDNISVRFTRRLYELAHEDIPDRIVNKARECFKDYISCEIGACKIYADINRQFIRQNHLTGSLHVFGFYETTDLRTAVMINAFNAHVLELDDSHRSAMTHLGAPIFSALISVAELYSCTLEAVLKAAVIGYEAAIRLANAIQPGHKKRGFHVSGTCCTVGSAMGIAAMLDYTETEFQNVFSAAVTSAAGLLAVISGSSEQKPYNIANAAVAGVTASLYGRYFIGAVDVLGDSRGFFHAMTDVAREDRLFEPGYAIEGIYQKLYAACRHCHAPMEAMLKICKEHDLNAENINNIDVKTYDLAVAGHDHTHIAGISSARQSIPYGVAVAAVYGNCGPGAFTQEKITDSRVLNLSAKVKVRESAELTMLVPQKRAAILTVEFNDGTKIANQVDYAKGEPENPITQQEWSDKFYELLGSAEVSGAVISQLEDYIAHGDHTEIGMIFQILKEDGAQV